MTNKLLVIHNNKGGNNHLVATRVADRFGCDIVSAEDGPSLSGFDTIILVLPNVGDEELPQPMEDYLFGLAATDKKYCVCELGNYFGFENYIGCKKTAIRMLDGLGWRRISDVSLDSTPAIDWIGFEKWLQTLPFESGSGVE